MNDVHCRYGEAAQKTSTHNLGAYILHVIGKETFKTGLVDPSKTSHGNWDAGMLLAMTSVYGTMAASRGDASAVANANLVSQYATSEIARTEVYAASQKQSWSARLSLCAASLLDASAFEPVEKLLDIL